MKQIILSSFATFSIFIAIGQNYLAGPIGLYGAQYAGTTNIATGGNIVVGSGGNWTLAGNIISSDKGNSNTPSNVGRAETIRFDGTGTYSGASATAGVVGFVIDGYATASNQTNSFLLPIGNATAAYPVLVPAGLTVTAAYFDGSGNTQNKFVSGNSAATTQYSPYVDMPIGFLAGNYTFSYPAGFSNASFSSLLSSNNSSAGGTSNSTTYSLLKNVADFSNTAATTTAALPNTTTTQIYFASSAALLPIKLAGFTAIAAGCVAKLTWQTAAEFNSSYFAIEASTDAVNFKMVDKVASKNNAAGSVYFYATALTKGITFLRLKMVDRNGQYTYSNIVTLTGSGACSAGAPILIYPNPTSNYINIHGLAEGVNRLKLYDFAGKKVMEISSKTASHSINISRFAKGIYLLSIVNENGIKTTLKVEKQ